MKKVLILIMFFCLNNSYAQLNKMNINKIKLLNDIDSLVMNYSEWQNFKTFESDFLNKDIIDKYLKLFSKNSTIINHLVPIQFKIANTKYNINSIKFKTTNTIELKDFLVKNFKYGIRFKVLNKNISFSKIDSGIINIVMARQSNILHINGLNYNVFDTIDIKILIENNYSLKISSIDFIHKNAYKFEVLNDKDFDQIPDEIDTVVNEKSKVKPITSSPLKISKPIKKTDQVRYKKIGIIFSSGTNYQWFRTNNDVQKPYLITYPKNTQTPPLTFILDAYYKNFFYNNKIYLKACLNIMLMNYELYLLTKPNNFQFDKLTLTNDRFISLGMTLATGYVFKLSNKIDFDLDFGILINKIVNSNSEIKFYDNAIQITKNASFDNQYAYFLVSNPSINYQISNKSTLLFGVNAMFGQSVNNDNSNKNYSLLDNNKEFTPLENSTTKSIIRNVGLNIGIEYKIN